MQYAAHVWREGTRLLVEFPDCPGCQTFADTEGDVLPMAKDALAGWLEAHLVDGRAPPRPRRHERVPMGCSLLTVIVPPSLSVATQLRWARHDAGLTQARLARKAKVSQQQIAKLEHPECNPTLGTVARVAEVLGLQATVQLSALSRFAENLAVDRAGILLTGKRPNAARARGVRRQTSTR